MRGGWRTEELGGARLLSALLRALVFWLLPHFQILCPALMSPNLATRLSPCLFAALRDSVMDSSHRADLRLLLPPSLPPELIRGQWAGKKQQGGGRRGWLAGGSRRLGRLWLCQTDDGTVISCCCAQRIGANEVLTSAIANDPTSRSASAPPHLLLESGDSQAQSPHQHLKPEARIC